jgi:hypothetical protein
MKTLSLTLICLLSSLSAVAGTLQPAKVKALPFVAGVPASAGTGCVGGADVRIERNGRVTVLPAMEVKGTDALTSFSRVSCNIRIPLSVAKNYKLIIKEINNSGSHFVESHNEISVSQKLNFVGAQPSANPDLILSGEGQLKWKNAVPGKNLAESPCTSRDVMLALNTNMLLKKVSLESTNSIAQLDQTQFQISAVKCK